MYFSSKLSKTKEKIAGTVATAFKDLVHGVAEGVCAVQENPDGPILTMDVMVHLEEKDGMNVLESQVSIFRKI